MGTGAITQSIDVAQIVLYAFWIFFFWLIVYLIREGKREGFPLESDRPDYKVIQGWPAVPPPKTFRLADGTQMQAPHGRDVPVELAACRVGQYPGAPIEPTGNPMVDGIGPAAWTNRMDVCDHMLDGSPKIVPLRTAGDFSIATQDRDPRGMPVIGADGLEAGKVVDLWVDKMEMLFRYYEVRTNSGRTVLLPVGFSRVGREGVTVKSILSTQFDQVPTTRDPQCITMREEDRIMGYYGGGTLYATPDRQESFI